MQEDITKHIGPPLARRLGLWFSGIGIYYWTTWLYDYLVVSFLLWKYGNIYGGTIVMFVSMIVDIGTLKFYDWFKKDWLALETIKDMEHGGGRIGNVFHWLRGKGSLITMVVLSFLTNPFVVTAYMRKGAYQYDGMKKRDVIVFVLSSVLSNFYWIVIVGSGISIVKYLSSLFASI